MKKTILVLISLLLTMSLLLCGCQKDDVTVVEEDGEYTLSKEVLDDDIAQLKIFESGCFYLKGMMTDNTGETLPMEMAIKNGNSYMASQMEGITIAFMCVDGEYYMYYPDGECVLLLDDEVSGEMGMDPNSLSFDTANLAIGDVTNDDVTGTEDVTVGDKEAVCRTYQKADGEVIKTYMADGVMIRFQREDSNGNLIMQLDVEVIADVFPDSRVNLPAGSKLYKGATGMMSFMLKFAKAVGMDALAE